MSDLLYPELAGINISVSYDPQYSSKIMRSASGRELRGGYAEIPIYKFTLKYEFLRDYFVRCQPQAGSEFKKLLGFFMQHHGAFESFLFKNPDDYYARNVFIGTGDGVTTRFQLVRNFGGAIEPVWWVGACSLEPMMWSLDLDELMWSRANTDPLWRNYAGFLPGEYTLLPRGIIEFNTAPALGEPIYWTGIYYFRCRFSADNQAAHKFMRKLWEAQSVQLIGSLGGLI